VTDVEIHPLTPDRWGDLEELFGERGGADGCWCMYWRQSSAEYKAGRYEGNRRAFERRVKDGEPPPGLLAYVDGRPAAWCSLGQREEYGRLQRSRVLGPLDDRPVWAVVCFYVDRGHRSSGLARRLLEAAGDFARQHGASTLEGYPLDPDHRRPSSGEAYTGVVSMFRDGGFQEVARRGSTGRPIYRRELAESGH
jgi:GNAT superfamily N-acetyltransferase